MTKIQGLAFKCARCGSTFLFHVEGQHLYGCHDQGMCFNSDEYGEIHNNSYLNTVKGKELCSKCLNHADIMSFGLHT